MKIIALAIGVALLAAGCGTAQADRLDPKNDLHCSTALWVIARDAERDKAPADIRRTIFVFNAWYLRRVRENGTPDKAETSRLLKAAERDPDGIRSVASACNDRATRDAGFAAFMAEAGKAYDEAGG